MSIIKLNEPPLRFSFSKFAKSSSRLNWIRDQDNEINSASPFPIKLNILVGLTVKLSMKTEVNSPTQHCRLSNTFNTEWVNN